MNHGVNETQDADMSSKNMSSKKSKVNADFWLKETWMATKIRIPHSLFFQLFLKYFVMAQGDYIIIIIA